MSTVRERLGEARLYLCTPACDEAFLRAALDGGVDVVQLRDRSLDDDGLRRASEVFERVAHELGALFVLNDRPDLAVEVGADGVHLGQDDASPASARAVVGPDRVIGRSTHEPSQGDAALRDPDVDYVSIGPVHATPTKPGRPAAGVDYVRWAASAIGAAKPWFAIGGIDVTTIEPVVEAGASRVVVVRAITEAPDALAAAAELRSFVEVATSGRA